MRAFPSLSLPLLFFSLAALSGCAGGEDYSDGECPPLNNLGRVTSIDGPTIHVHILVPGPGSTPGDAVLHAEGAEFYAYAGSLDECFDQPRDMLTVGQEVEFFVDAWEKSSPPQAHVDAIVVRG